jgi:hypothetical protein
LIDVKSSIGKVAFNVIKGCKNKYHPGGNAAISWERLKNTYEPVSVPSMAKLEKYFREHPLKKVQEPQIRITELEDLQIKLKNDLMYYTESIYDSYIE